MRGTIPKGQLAQKSESSKATLEKQSKQTDEPVIPKIKWNQDSIELNSKAHKLPITKEYMLKEYSDVFKGIGTLPGGPYHIRLKEQYRPVQHPPRSVPVAMQDAYKAELERLTKEGIITEVKETHRVDQLQSTSNETKWQSKTVPWPQRPKQSNGKEPMVFRDYWWHTTRAGQIQVQNIERCYNQGTGTLYWTVY